MDDVWDHRGLLKAPVTSTMTPIPQAPARPSDLVLLLLVFASALVLLLTPATRGAHQPRRR